MKSTILSSFAELEIPTLLPAPPDFIQLEPMHDEGATHLDDLAWEAEIDLNEPDVTDTIPNWVEDFSSRSCTIEKGKDGRFYAVCHDLQQSVANSANVEHLREWIQFYL